MSQKYESTGEPLEDNKKMEYIEKAEQIKDLCR